MNESPVTGPARRDSVVLLSQLIRQESRILLREPQWLASHLHNVLFLDHGPEGSAAVIEDLARDALAHRPWLRLLNRSGGAPSALRAVLDHGARVTAMAWSSDSKFLASGGTDGAVRLWEWPSGKMHHELTKISAPVTSLTWSPDGDLASGHSDGTALTWDSGTWRVKANRHVPPGPQGPVQTLVAFSSRGSLAIGAREDVFIFERGSSAVSRQKHFQLPISSLAWAPDGGQLAFASPGTVAGQGGPYAGCWDVSGNRIRMILRGESDTIDAVAWLADGNTIAANGINGTIFLWDEAGGRVSGRLTRRRKGHGLLAASSIGGRLASSRDESAVCAWDPAHERLLAVHRGHTQRVTSLAWSPDGKVLATGSLDETIRIWEASFESPGAVDSDAATVGSVAWSPDGSVLASASPDGILLLDQETGKETAVMRPQEDLGIAVQLEWSAPGSHLTLVDDFFGEERIRIVELSSGAWSRLEYVGTAFAWSPVGSTLAVNGGDGIILIDADTRGRKLLEPCSGFEAILRSGLYQWVRDTRVLPGHAGDVSTIAWSPSGSLLASGDNSGTIVVWNPRRRRSMHARFKGGEGTIRRLSWSPEEQWLASTGDQGTVRLWDVPRKRPGCVISADAYLLCFSPVGHMLATGGTTGLRLWDTETGQEQTSPNERPSAPLAALAWSQDGRFITTAGQDGSVRVFESHNGNLLASAFCRSAVLALKIMDSARVVKAADDGAATGNHVMPYLFQMCNE